MIAPIFASGDTELQEKLRRHVMLPYIMADFIPEHKSELAGAKSLIPIADFDHAISTEAAP